MKYKENAFTFFAAELLYEIHTKLANIEEKIEGRQRGKRTRNGQD